MLANGHSVEVAALLLPISSTCFHQADNAVADIVAGGLAAFVASDGHLDAVDGGIGRNGKAIIGAFQVMRSGATERDSCINAVSSGDVAGVHPDDQFQFRSHQRRSGRL